MPSPASAFQQIYMFLYFSFFNTRSLDEKIRKLDEQLLKHRDAIRKMRPGAAQDAAKQRALAVLKQKRMYEQQREQLYGQQANIDGATFMMEGLQTNIQVVSAMSEGNKQMQTMMKKNKELQIDNVYKTMDQMADLHADFEEIQDALGSYNAPVDVDEDELMGELDALGDEVLAEGAASDGVPAYLQDLPEAPQAFPQGALPNAPLSTEEPLPDAFGLPIAR